jgi:protein ImuB
MSIPPPLWLCLRVPTLPVDVFARAWSGDDALRPFVVASGGHYPRVVGTNAAATEAGIRAGQLISAALALAPGLAMRDRDIAAESAALADIATTLLGCTPSTSLAPPDAVVADIGPSLRLFGGLRRLVARVVKAVHAQGYAPTLGLAPTAEAALLLARAGRAEPVLDPAALPAALHDLGLELFDLPSSAADLLRAAGVTTIGAMAALPRAGLARRCGAATVAALDRALGHRPSARAFHAPPPCFTGRLPLPAPATDTEALGFGLNRLVQQLSHWLNARGLGVTRLTLTLVHEHHMRVRGIPDTVVPFALGAPARAVAHLQGVLRERIARVALPAPVETLLLATNETAPLAGRNLGLLPGDEARDVTVPLLERLRARLGDDAVAVLAPRAEHRPELAQCEAAVPAAARAPAAVDDLSASAAARTNEPLPPRPLWLLEEAEPIGPALERKPWILRDGPERIESGWWDGRDLRRDYFVAETPGGALMWIYRDHRHGVDDGEWFLHGVYA